MTRQLCLRPRRRHVAALVTGLVLVITAPASADPNSPSAVGGFQGVLAEGAVQTVAFSATLTPNGVVGYLTETIVFQGEVSMLRGTVVCLSVSGDVAAISFEVLESTGILTNPYTVGSVHTLVVQDSEAGDTFAFVAAECTNVPPPAFPISHGNISVLS